VTAGLRSRTVKLDETPDLIDLVPPEGGLGWLSEATSLVAHGPFLPIESGSGTGQFENASAAFRRLVDRGTVEDEVDLPGTGPVLFGSFTFDPEASGSLVLVPSVIYGSTECVAWKSEIDLRGADPAWVGESHEARKDNAFDGEGSSYP
jgi:menaquinone-specific isochorismate synthase